MSDTTTSTPTRLPYERVVELAEAVVRSAPDNIKSYLDLCGIDVDELTTGEIVVSANWLNAITEEPLVMQVGYASDGWVLYLGDGDEHTDNMFPAPDELLDNLVGAPETAVWVVCLVAGFAALALRLSAIESGFSAAGRTIH